GKFTRPWLGIGIRPFRDDLLLRERLKQVKDGVVVSSVMRDGPAAKSDLKANDIILAVDGHHVGTPQQLRTQLRGKPIGQAVTLEVFRKNKTIQLNVTTAEWVQSTNILASARRESADESVSVPLGLTIHTLTDELATQFGVEM